MSIYDSILRNNQDSTDQMLMLQRLKLEHSPLDAFTGEQEQMQNMRLKQQQADLMDYYRRASVQDRALGKFQQYALPNVTPQNYEAVVAQAQQAGLDPSIVPKQQFTAPTPGTQPQDLGSILGVEGGSLMTPGVPGQEGEAIPGSGYGMGALMNKAKLENYQSLAEARKSKEEINKQLADARQKLIDKQISLADYLAQVKGLNAQANMLSAGARQTAANASQQRADQYGNPMLMGGGVDEEGNPVDMSTMGMTSVNQTAKILESVWGMDPANAGKTPPDFLAQAREQLGLGKLSAPTAGPSPSAAPQPNAGLTVGQKTSMPDGVYHKAGKTVTVQNGVISEVK